MKKSLGLLAAWSIIVVSCQDSLPSKKDDPKENFLAPFAGIYMDTIPAPNAVGNIVQLTINADSTFSILQRVMKFNDPVIRPISTAGKIEFLESGSKWKLIPQNAGAATWYVALADGVFTVLDSTGNTYSNATAYQLQRMSSASNQIGRDRLFSTDKGQVRFPLGVYNRPAGNNITVSTFYLQSCSEAELALCYAYTRQFEGKMEGQNPIAMVLAKDVTTLNAIVDRTVYGLEGAAWNEKSCQDILTSVIFNKTPETMIVTYTYLDQNDQNWMAKDVFAIKDGKLTLTAKGKVESLSR
jgi:hypothetical protein